MTLLTVEQAEDLAARTLVAIGDVERQPRTAVRDADRERVASDLAGLRLIRDPAVWTRLRSGPHETLLQAFSDGLLRTAALYGVTL